MTEGPYVLGIDFGTESVRVGIFDREGTPLVFAGEAYDLEHPYPGWAEQDPDEWWSCLIKATRKALDEGEVAPEEICGLSVDATTSTVVALDRQERILRPAIMWMDVRAVDQARRVAETGDPALKYSGYTHVSAEWMPPKALWLKENEPENYENAYRICECLDWITHRLTGEWTASLNIASFRWYYDRNEGGLPDSLYGSLGLDDLLDKFPQKVLEMGEVVGGLRKEAAEELGLPVDISVAEGGGDAFVALIGLDVLEPRKMALITGSSHVIVGQAAEPEYGAGVFGAYADAIVPGQYSVEGGQASTGSLVKWFKDNFAKNAGEEARRRGVDAYEVLGEMAAQIPPGSEGLMVLDYWQGNRTPYTDPEARGVMWGLSLRHQEGHVFRAILEGICYGTEHILRTMRDNGFEPREGVVCGGPTKSELWMQMHADVSNLPISFTRVPDAPALGSAILGAVGAGIYPDIQEAARNMVHVTNSIEPDPAMHEEYKFYVDKYAQTYPQMKDLMHEVSHHVASQDRG
ncbi:MAG: xylulose kinase [Rubrobacter sp.]|nr:xylulose kinase [Rubrobacter sp.]